MAKILVVDDHQANREFLASLLGYHGHQIIEAADGADALAATRTERPALVICDILMPNMDGYEFVRQLRADPVLAATLVIFYTAHFLERDARDLARAAGVVHILAKPCEPEVLLGKVNEVLAGLPTATPAARLSAFDDEHLRLITNKLSQKTEELHKTNQRLAALVELNLQLASQRDPLQLVEIVCHGARELVDAGHGALVIRDKNDGGTTHFVTSGIEPRTATRLSSPPLDRGLLNEVLANGRVLRLSGAEVQDVGLPAEYPAFDSLLAAPIASLTQVYGWVCLTGKTGSPHFSEEDQHLLTVLAAETGRIYENGSLYLRVRHHAVELEQEVYQRKRAQQRLATQYAIAQVLAETKTFEEATSKILRAIAENLDYQIGMLWEVDGKADVLRCVDAWHTASDPITQVANTARPLSIQRGAGIAGQAWSGGKPVWVSDTLKIGGFASAPTDARDGFTNAGLHGAVAFPIALRGEIRGVADFFTTDILDPVPDPALLDMFSAIGSQIGQFMERRAQQQNIFRLNRLYSVLSAINTTIVRVRDRDELFRKACLILLEQGRFEMVWIGVVDPDTQAITPVAWRGPDADYAHVSQVVFSAREDAPTGQATVGRAVRSKLPVYSNDLTLEGNLRPMFLDLLARGYRSVISLPLISGEVCSGVLVLYSKEAGVFEEDEKRLLAELADDVSFALDYISNEERVSYLAFHDPLTGLANRTMLRHRLTQVMDDVKLQRLPFALLLMNINNFRDINDTLGHHNGDLLLISVAKRLSSALWESDVVACLGGDEFAVLLPHLADKRDIDLVTGKITDSLQEPFIVQELPVNVEARIGIALYPDHGNDADLLWQHADIALRAAKELHRTLLLYGVEIDHYDPKHLALLGGMREAIDRNELVLHYQPKIDLKAGHATGIEALLRWQHPERGLIFPDAFIPLVEQTGLINPLTAWVLANALRQGQAWRESGLPLELSVNLSARNLQKPGLSTDILDLVRSSRFPLDQLTLEITESAIMADPERARSVLAELRETGIQLSMDDFGIGQSSLSYLKDLPISKMKIDKSFVMKFDEPRNAAIVRSAIELGHNLDLSVTAEGVENEATCLALRELGCDLAQGYYFSKPLPVDKLTAWLRESPWRCPAS